ncbi:MAG: DNA-formamidopyrimidine glycosylase [Minisyncoccia bacterium]
MPELPEVQTTVDGLNRTVKGKVILDVWTDYKSDFHAGKDNIKNPKFFKIFKKEVIGTKILRAERRGKNILISLDNGKTILAHMKMTGFFFYNPPKDERFVRVKFYLDNKKILAFSDMRKFAKITLIESKDREKNPELSHLGPDALDITLEEFKKILSKEKRPIKQMLMDQTLLTGVGNIYSDESLWLAQIHPRSIPNKIPNKQTELLLEAIKKVLHSGIDFGGDSMSDYRNIYGEKGKFQNKHNAYRKTGEKCSKKNCKGIITRDVVATRSAHFCSVHQHLYN